MTSLLKSSHISQRVDELLARMTLDQKIGQMTQPERMACTPQDVKDYHLGSVLSGGGSCPGDNLPADWVEMNDAYWAASMEADDDHLAIPLIYGVDAIHGNSNVRGATVFPHNMGLGAANDPELLKRIAQATAREILATGVDWTFAPTLAVAQDYHWGRCYESYSKNSDLVSAYAAPFVAGLQDNLGDDAVVGCVKHWVGDGGTTNGIDQGETTLSEEQLRAVHIAPYHPAIEQGVLTIMASFNSWNGDKCHGHKYLLTDVLKDEMGFDGYIISDWDGIDYLSEDYFTAVGLGVNAGIDMFMVSEDWRNFIAHVRTHVEAGTIAISRIDDAVRRILSVKVAFGLFDKPRPSERKWSNHASYGGVEHRAIAREAVRKSLVLLKNEDQTLPLQNDARILVAGKSAHNRGHQCGGFTVAWQGVRDNESIEGGTSVWEGIQAVAPNASLSADGLGLDASAEQHDVAVVVIGETPYAEGMGDVRSGNDVIVQAGSQIKGLLKVLEPYGDSLELARSHPEDLAVINNIRRAGVPVVAIMVSGRPLVINQELAESAAFIAAWLPGSEGQGVADVLFGEYDFQGRLSFPWPAAEQPGDADAIENGPLFPFGFGLSYKA
ncbi:MAG: glycoside hydrolase family 3 protein [Gammaproteobacteria bacterium]|nr:glycoside hydrolase family 3 protein [Gammaproteobacteria bacterium]